MKIIPPKEKADNIVKKYWLKNKNGQDSYGTAINNAKIAVDEIVEAGNSIIAELIDGYHDLEFNIYWQEVKNELNKI